MKEPFSYHDEVVAALARCGSPAHGAAVAADRGSKLEYLGVSAPDQRRLVKQGFSFYSLPAEEVLGVWDVLWKQSPYGEVLFAAVEYYLPRVRKNAGDSLWPVVSTWTPRVDNWAHADALAGLYSWLLAAEERQVYPQLQAWNQAESQWLRRISLVSLIHYTG